MNFSLIDAAGLIMAVASYAIVLILPGAALASLSGSLGFDDARTGGRPLVAIVAGLAMLPALYSLAARFFGLDAALGVALVLAGVACAFATRQSWRLRLDAISIAILAVWLLVLIVEWIDYDTGSRLYQPFIVIDMVKHAATSQAILDTGAPPHDPFFARPQPVSYYYFFYTLTALSQRLCGGLVDARAAVGGLAFWTGVGIYALARVAIARAGLLPAGLEGRVRSLLLTLLAASGLDVIFVIGLGLALPYWLPEPLWWSDAAAGWFEATIWVPHHLCGLIAGMTGLMALAHVLSLDATLDRDTRSVARAIVTAALCFASALGLSVWLTLATVATTGLWLVVLLVERRWRHAGIVVLGGLLAVVVATPAILDLAHNRAPGPFPIVAAVHKFTPIDFIVQDEPLRSLARIVTLPLNYLAQFGVLLLGAGMFWNANRRRDVHRNEFARVLTLGAIAGLLLGSFLRSTLLGNNDLGWRVFMVPQLAGLVWTLAILLQTWAALSDPARRLIRRLFTPSFWVLLLIGYATTAYAAVGLRAYPLMRIAPLHRHIAASPAVTRALRVAYEWANKHLPHDMVLQHNPKDGGRAVSFGLYSRNPVGISDQYGSLFGADANAVTARLAALAPLFQRDQSDETLAQVARDNHIDAFMVTPSDPVWGDPTSWVWRTAPVYAAALVRIIPVIGIGHDAHSQ